MSYDDLSPAEREMLAELEAEVPRLESALRGAEAAYAAERPRFEEWRKTSPEVQQKEVQMIQAFRTPLALSAVLVVCNFNLACRSSAPGDTPSFEPITYVERDLASINDRCPVRKSPLNPAVAPVYVHGRPIGFC